MVDQPDLLKADLLPREPEGKVEAAPEVPPAPEVEAPVEEEPQPENEPQSELTPEEKQEEKEAHDVAESLAPVAPEPTVEVQKDPVLVDLEGLLSNGLDDIFVGLSDDKKPLFKQKGEEAAVAIRDLVATGKATGKKILDIIRDWLRIVPGINKFFLEQEAKIKTDNIMEYVEGQQGVDQNQI